MMKRFKRSWLVGGWGDFWDVVPRCLAPGFAVIVAITGYAASPQTTKWLALTFALLFIFGYASVLYFRACYSKALGGQGLSNWVSGRDSSHESARRRALEGDQGSSNLPRTSATALAVEHAVNMTGNTPMVQGTGHDIHGNPYGITQDVADMGYASADHSMGVDAHKPFG